MDIAKVLEVSAYILPLLICIYQLGRVISEHDRMKDDLRKLEESDIATNSRIEDVKSSTETALSTLVTQLTGISVQIARIETAINIDKINSSNQNI